MEVKLDPRVIEAIGRGELRRDWRSIAKRLEAFAPAWVLVGVTKRSERGAAVEVRERLAAVGCRAQTCALLGLGGIISSEGLYAGELRPDGRRMPPSPRPWTGWAVYARIPR